MADEKNGRFEQILEPLNEERDKLLTKQTELRGELAEVKEELRTIERVLKSAGLIETNKRPARTLAGPAAPIPPEIVKQAREWIFGQEHFTRTRLIDAIKIGEPRANRLIEQFRQSGEIRLIGQFKGGQRYKPAGALARGGNAK